MIWTKVARIIDPTQVVLAVGEKDGVKQGMEFIIYDLSDSIRDPETGEDLGQIEIVKGRVFAEHVQDKITIATTRSRRVERTVDILGTLAVASMLAPRKITEIVQDQLKVEGAIAIQTDPVVRVGDRVRSVNVSESAYVLRAATA